MLREAELRQRGVDTLEDDLRRHFAPSSGDVVGLGGSVMGDVMAGLPGGAALGFGGQLAGGNKVGKAVGSTLGSLIGAVLGPIGGIVGSIAGGFAGRQMDQDDSPSGMPDALGAVYIEGMDTGPLVVAANK